MPSKMIDENLEKRITDAVEKVSKEADSAVSSDTIKDLFTSADAETLIKNADVLAGLGEDILGLLLARLLRDKTAAAVELMVEAADADMVIGLMQAGEEQAEAIVTENEKRKDFFLALGKGALALLLKVLPYVLAAL